MSLCLLEFWVPQHEVSSTFTLCMSATGMNKSIMHLWSKQESTFKKYKRMAPGGTIFQVRMMEYAEEFGPTDRFYSVPVNQNESD